MTDLYRQGYLQALEDLKAQILSRWKRVRGLVNPDNYDEARMDSLEDTLCRIDDLRASLGDGPAPQEEAMASEVNTLVNTQTLILRLRFWSEALAGSGDVMVRKGSSLAETCATAADELGRLHQELEKAQQERDKWLKARRSRRGREQDAPRGDRSPSCYQAV